MECGGMHGLHVNMMTIYIYMRANQRTLDSSRLSNKAIGLYCYTEDSMLSIFFVLDEVVCLN
jgi:hypothetical protein